MGLSHHFGTPIFSMIAEGEKFNQIQDELWGVYNKINMKHLPFCPDGFFWGQQFQEESMKEYKEQDLEFCEAAIEWTDEGKTAWYGCDW